MFTNKHFGQTKIINLFFNENIYRQVSHQMVTTCANVCYLCLIICVFLNYQFKSAFKKKEVIVCRQLLQILYSPSYNIVKHGLHVWCIVTSLLMQKTCLCNYSSVVHTPVRPRVHCPAQPKGVWQWCVGCRMQGRQILQIVC